jgi:hypothetical protein
MQLGCPGGSRVRRDSFAAAAGTGFDLVEGVPHGAALP